MQTNQRHTIQNRGRPKEAKIREQIESASDTPTKAGKSQHTAKAMYEPGQQQQGQQPGEDADAKPTRAQIQQGS